MKLSFLDPLYASPGPYASVYLDTSGDIGDPEKAIELRWRHVRDDLTGQGADAATIQALAEAMGGDAARPGRHGQALFAARGRLLLVAELPEPPAREVARFGPLPEAMPLVFQRAPDIPYAAVVIQRPGPEEIAAGPGELHVELEIGRWPTSRVTPGPRVRRFFPPQTWREGASQVVDDLADRSAGHPPPDVVVVCGPVEERGILVNQLPAALRPHVIALDPGTEGTDEEATDPGQALLERRLSARFRDRLSARDATQTDLFLAQRARAPGESEGIVATVGALQRAQARALLVNPSADLTVRLWIGAEPTEIGLAAAELAQFGVRSAEERTAGAALLRAAARTGAELVVVPEEKFTMDGRLGVLLRYTEPREERAP
ncbi:baeRF2 domain-containing protein [Streptomyces litchfieldiae]|uniref:Peptide chain release factor 1 n=1 Tax=Streptomyces litchfieldiae TaxID=3075543 RepID=A0ABU2MPP7_9ACTN|nr:hypothetical protein [Streptomyces sp. DSM 44938]MDT0343579.1 hypothetical protein [Streptomyces sp. DSM 44938]